MLINLHVKNFALIGEADVDFKEGLNILTGETGAGKSILIDSVNAALGGRMRADVVGKDSDSAEIELVFSIDSDRQRQALAALDIDTEYDTIILSRRISGGRSVHKINDTAVTAAKARAASELLIDIHGQHEHQSLTQKKRQLEILDKYAGNDEGIKKVSKLYDAYRECLNEVEALSIDAASLERELDFLKFECAELEAAAVKRGEKEELSETFKRYRNSARLASSMSDLVRELSGDRDCAAERLNRAIKAASDAQGYDGSLKDLLESLQTAEDLISGICRDARDYADSLKYDPEDYAAVSDRLDEINRLEQKYGTGFDALEAALYKRKKRIDELEHSEERRELAKARLQKVRGELDTACSGLHHLRAKAAQQLKKAVSQTLAELNFLDNRFDIKLTRREEYSSSGTDEAEFMIALNPGEVEKPVEQVASGGELSRIMLGIREVLSDRNETPTLIFDEIDAGISGRTAQFVSQKLYRIARHSQVICITHLPQIAAMADAHFCIEKEADNNRTRTRVKKLSENEAEGELARLLGGAKITDRVLENAREMKALAGQFKRESGID